MILFKIAYVKPLKKRMCDIMLYKTIIIVFFKNQPSLVSFITVNTYLICQTILMIDSFLLIDLFFPFTTENVTFLSNETCMEN